MKRARCKPNDHTDRRMRGGRRVRCTTCGDAFPCRHDCERVDCILATGRELPDWITLAPKGTP